MMRKSKVERLVNAKVKLLFDTMKTLMDIDKSDHVKYQEALKNLNDRTIGLDNKVELIDSKVNPKVDPDVNPPKEYGKSILEYNKECGGIYR